LSNAAGSNSGGFALPSLGSLTSGISNSNIVGQQLQAATVNFAGTAASTLAGGVLKGVATGLGSTGTSIVTMAAAAIANPSAALVTVENMAIKFAEGAAMVGVNYAASQVGGQIASGISSGLSDLNSSLAFNGASTFIGGVQSLGTSASAALQNAISPANSGTGVTLTAQPALALDSDLSSPATFGISSVSPGFGINFGSAGLTPTD
jgi:hypothetical protein